MVDQSGRHPSASEARSHIYGLFARAFSHPDTDLLDSVFCGDYFQDLLEASSYLPYPSPFPENAPRLVGVAYDRADIDIFFASAFEAGQTGISLRESAYSTKTENEILEDTFRFYEHFGLNFSAGELRELPDMLPVELEFMHYLAYLQAQSVDDGTIKGLILAQADFHKRHLISWTPSLVKVLIERASGRLYDELILLLHGFLLVDGDYLQDIR